MRRGDYYPSVGGNRNDNDGDHFLTGRMRKEEDDDDDDDDDDDRPGGGSSCRSHIVSIRSTNIAGMIGDNDGGVEGGDGNGGSSSSEIRVDFGNEACFVVVTGER